MRLTPGGHAKTTRRAIDNSKAVDAFMAARAEIGVMLERLKALSDDHFEAHPDEINWGHVGNAYLIHLGSAAVRIAGSLSHVCIVPKPQPATALPLPFEGDTIFAVILSKALMLARDDLITDHVILRQI